MDSIRKIPVNPTASIPKKILKAFIKLICAKVCIIITKILQNKTKEIIMKKANKISSDMLIAIYQNLLTARQSINNIIEKVSESRLKKELSKQYESYTPIKEECEALDQKH